MNLAFGNEVVERHERILATWQSFKDWQSFKGYNLPTSARRLIDDVIDRSEAGLPDWFAPWAPGVVIAGSYLLEAAGYKPGPSLRKRGWSLREDGYAYTMIKHGNRLKACPCGKFWTIERQNGAALCFYFGPLPVFARTAREAMYVGEYCHPSPLEGEYPFPAPRGVARSLRWIEPEFWECRYH
jgi:hypothetical protein